MAVREWFESRPKMFFILLGLLLVEAVGFADYLTGYRMAFSIFYLIPIYLVTSNAGKSAGFMISFISAATWLLADFAARVSYTHPAVPFWNAAVRLGVFLIVVAVLSKKETVLASEKMLARTDPLTGVRNRRAFFELTRKEISRSRRYNHSLAVLYIDCDDFKTINDQFGHETGDTLLLSVANTLKENVRIMDIVARIGGDEFAVLMPETLTSLAREAALRIRHHLAVVMGENGWQVTYSIGVATYLRPPDSAEEIISKADSLMYLAKNRGKDTVVEELLSN